MDNAHKSLIAVLITTLLSFGPHIAPRAAAQNLVLPEYPASRLDVLLQMQGASDGPIFRNFLAEVVFASALSRGDETRLPESVERLKTVFAKYPGVIGWLNGGLAEIARDAALDNILGNVDSLQAKVDSILYAHLKVEQISRQIDPRNSIESLLAPGVEPRNISNVRYVALGVLERFYKDADAERRRNLIDGSINDSLFVQIIQVVNQTLTCNPEHETCQVDFSDLLDVGAITAGMPPKYAEVLEELLPRYYARFRDKHLLVIFYLMAEPPRRMSALFQASGPALQKVFQMIGDYSNNQRVRKQLSELKSGIQAFGQEDIRGLIDTLLVRSVPDSVRRALDVDYSALGAGTIAQVHKILLNGRSGASHRFVIKVKRPGLKEAVEREMDVLGQLASGALASKLIRDVRATLEREMNLGNEAEEIHTAAAVYKHPKIGVIGVSDLIAPSDSLIAFEFARGRTLDKVNEKLDAVNTLVRKKGHLVNRPVADHYMANLLSTQAKAIFELLKIWFHEAIFGGGFFHGDLHSGNIFIELENGRGKFKNRFRDNYRLTLVDFGNTGKFTRKQQKGVIELSVAVAKREPEQVLNALVNTQTIKETDIPTLRSTVENILASKTLTSGEKSDRIATVAYAEGTANTRDLLSFTRGRILLETQLLDLNRRLDQVDPAREYRRYSPSDAYRGVIKKRIIWHCVRSLFGLKWRGNRIITCGEARAIGRAAKEDRKLEALRKKSSKN